MSQITGITKISPLNWLIQRVFARDESRAGKALQVTKVGGLVPEAYDARTRNYDTVQEMDSVRWSLNRQM